MSYSVEFLQQEWHSDYVLVQGVLKGNIQNWNRLYCESYPYVYQYVNRIHQDWLISRDEIEDVVNEAFKRCYLKLSSYMGKSKFTTWVCGFCRYILLNYYHKYRLQKKYIVDLFNNFQLSGININPEEFVIKNEQHLCLWSAYYSLTYKHQMLLKCYILKEIRPSQMKRTVQLNTKDRKHELNIAVNTLRNRFLALYERG